MMRHVRFGALPLAIALSTGCADLTRPSAHQVNRVPATPTPLLQASAAPSVAKVASPMATGPAPTVPKAAEQIGASHILVAYQGATRAKPTVTRTKEEARALATRLSVEAHAPGTDFGKLAKDVSDGPSGVEGGALPKFGREQMVQPFSDAAFGLKPGEISGVVETNFGFHVIKRTE
jgi:parvulin-like peptidyl-prolyl isomerase